MKYRLYLLFIITILFCSASNVQAGFIVKKSAVTEHSATKGIVHNNAISTLANQEENHTSVFNTIKNLSPVMRYYRHRPSEWVGIVALLMGVLGTFIPGVNFLAILFGALGMGRKCQTGGLALAGLLLGILELIFYLIVGGTLVSMILL